MSAWKHPGTPSKNTYTSAVALLMLNLVSPNVMSGSNGCLPSQLAADISVLHSWQNRNSMRKSTEQLDPSGCAQDARWVLIKQMSQVMIQPDLPPWMCYGKARAFTSLDPSKTSHACHRESKSAQNLHSKALCQDGHLGMVWCIEGVCNACETYPMLEPW